MSMILGVVLVICSVVALVKRSDYMLQMMRTGYVMVSHIS